MKKFFLLFIIMFSLCGCNVITSETNYTIDDNITYFGNYEHFTIIETTDGILGEINTLVYNNDTKEKYHIYYSNREFAITKLYNVDGSPQLYVEE